MPGNGVLMKELGRASLGSLFMPPRAKHQSDTPWGAANKSCVWKASRKQHRGRRYLLQPRSKQCLECYCISTFQLPSTQAQTRAAPGLGNACGSSAQPSCRGACTRTRRRKEKPGATRVGSGTMRGSPELLLRDVRSREAKHSSSRSCAWRMVQHQPMRNNWPVLRYVLLRQTSSSIWPTCLAHPASASWYVLGA